MRFAKIVFRIAGIWGVLIIAPLYFIFDTIGRRDPPPITHPGFFYGFVGLALAWQFAFLFIATDPVRYRLLMLAAMLEKFPFTLACLLLYAAGSVPESVLVAGLIDGVFGVLFSIAYIMTDESAEAE